MFWSNSGFLLQNSSSDLNLMYFQKIQHLTGHVFPKDPAFVGHVFPKDPAFAGHVFQMFQLLLVMYFKRSSFRWSCISNVPAFCWSCISKVPAFCWSCISKIKDCNSRSHQNLYWVIISQRIRENFANLLKAFVDSKKIWLHKRISSDYL